MFEKLVKRPQTRKALKKKGPTRSPVEEKGMKVLKVITHDLRNSIKHPKCNNKIRRQSEIAGIFIFFFVTSLVSKLITLDRHSAI